MDKRRKINGQDSPYNHPINGEDDLDFLALSLTPFEYPTTIPQPQPPPLPHKPPHIPKNDVVIPPPSASRPRRPRRNPTRAPREGKSETIPIHYPWSTNKRATIQTLNYLKSNQILTIPGDVQCKKCDRVYQIEFDLESKYLEIGRFIVENKSSMCHRAAKEWQSPVLPKCVHCEHENCVRPVIAEKKKAINWLFLLLGNMLGCCTLDQLKYFCKHTKNHRTGAKDRVLYLTYLALCKQLDPQGPFDP